MSDTIKGILAILCSALGFTVNDTLVKLVTAELPTSEIIVLRGVMATALLAIAASIAGAWRSPRALARPAMMVRLVTSAGSTLFIVAALRHLPLSTTSAILQFTPLVVTSGAAIMLGMPVGWQRWMASAAGLLGVLIIIRPGTEGFVPEIWIAFATLFFSSTRDLTTRFIDAAVPSLFVAVASSAVITVAGICLAPFESWNAPSLHAWALLVAASASIYVAYYFGIVAMRIGDITVVAPFRYALIVYALIMSYFVWGDVPDAISLLGIAIVCGAGLYLLYRERAARAAKPVAAMSPVKNVA